MEDSTLNIVILGASFAGLSAAHHILTYTIPALDKDESVSAKPRRLQPKYRVILVSPSTHIYWNIAAPRALVSFRLIPYDKMFLPISEGLKKYASLELEFVQGAATSIDTRSRTVLVDCLVSADNAKNMTPANSKIPAELAAPSTKTMTIDYHALVIATGSTAHSPLLSLRGPHHTTRTSLDAFHASLLTAQNIAVAGGGPSGVEVAGQIAHYCNRSHRGRSSIREIIATAFKNVREGPTNLSSALRNGKAPTKPTRPAKKVILYCGAETLLPKLEKRIGAKALKQLERLGVEVVLNTRVEGASVEGATGITTLTFSNGSTAECDLYVPCTGVSPNTAFFQPDSPLLRDGYIATTEAPSTLRVQVPDTLLPTPQQQTVSSELTALPAMPTSKSNIQTNPPRPLSSSSPTYAPPALNPNANPSATATATPLLHPHFHPATAPRIYALGDCAAYSANCVLDVYAAIPTLLTNLLADLRAYQLYTENIYGGNDERIAALLESEGDAVYVPDERASQLVPIGFRKPGGVGALLGFRLPSLVVWLAKGRTYRVEKAAEVVMEGINPYK